MKIRSGFVSNSSSSSFILGFDNQIKRKPVEKLKEILFGDSDTIRDNDSPKYSFPTLEVAEYIHSHLRSVPEKEVWKLINSGYIEENDGPDYWKETEKHPDFKAQEEILIIKFNVKRLYDISPEDKQKDKDWKKLMSIRDKLFKQYLKKCEKWSKEHWKKEKKKFEGKKLYTITLHDDGPFSSIESGYIFDSIPSIKISHH